MIPKAPTRQAKSASRCSSDTIFFFPRIGGKSALSPRLIEKFPKDNSFDTYVEPFCGSAQTFLRYCPLTPKRMVLNDLDPEISSMWSDVKRSSIGALQKMDWTGSKDRFQSMKANNEWKYLTPSHRLFRNMYLSLYSFAGDRDSGYMEKGCVRGRGFLKTLPLLKRKMKNVSVHNQSFQDVIRTYDSPTTFFYLDPPYFEKEHLYGGRHVDPSELATWCKAIRGRFLLSYNDHPHVRLCFRQFHIRTIPTTYSASKNCRTRELLISNY
ncbi:hypothetical protein EBZ80_13945 [bacterium]|nr:hypothetical protein [bacterium]